MAMMKLWKQYQTLQVIRLDMLSIF